MNGCNVRVITIRGRGVSFHGPVISGEAGGHRSKPKVVLVLFVQEKNLTDKQMNETIMKSQKHYRKIISVEDVNELSLLNVEIFVAANMTKIRRSIG